MGCWSTGVVIADGVLPESVLVERFIRGLNEGPLKALGFFYALDCCSTAGAGVVCDEKLGVCTLD